MSRAILFSSAAVSRLRLVLSSQWGSNRDVGKEKVDTDQRFRNCRSGIRKDSNEARPACNTVDPDTISAQWNKERPSQYTRMDHNEEDRSHSVAQEWLHVTNQAALILDKKVRREINSLANQSLLAVLTNHFLFTVDSLVVLEASDSSGWTTIHAMLSHVTANGSAPENVLWIGTGSARVDAGAGRHGV